MNDSIKRKKLWVFASGLIAGMALMMLVYTVGCSFYAKNGNANNNTLSKPKESVDSVLDERANKKIDTIYKILDSNYVEEYDVNDTREMMYAGLVAGIGDPYTSYMTADQFERFSEDTEGEYEGLGIIVSVDEYNRIIVVAPFDDSPGAKAGIKSKDCIIKVDSESVYGDKLDDAIKMMKGPKGTTVTITIYRESETEGDRTFDLEIIRDKIEMQTVKHRMLENEIGYLRITGFERVTLDQFKEAYNDLKANGMKGLILDLRNNPGGLLDVVINITDIIVPEGTIVYTEDKNGKRNYAKSDKASIDMPLLILVNGGSASASEVLSGAVKDLGVGKLVGQTTFGKGLVQNIFNIGDGSALKVTIARYYTPSGVCIHGTGIEPDYPIEMSDDLAAEISMLTLEEDIQLSEAVRIMLKEYLQ